MPPQNVHDNMVIEAFTFVQKKEFLDAWSVIEKIHLDDLTKEFRVEALNLRGTFKYLMGDGAFLPYISHVLNIHLAHFKKN